MDAVWLISVPKAQKAKFMETALKNAAKSCDTRRKKGKEREKFIIQVYHKWCGYVFLPSAPC